MYCRAYLCQAVWLPLPPPTIANSMCSVIHCQGWWGDRIGRPALKLCPIDTSPNFGEATALPLPYYWYLFNCYQSLTKHSGFQFWFVCCLWRSIRFKNISYIAGTHSSIVTGGCQWAQFTEKTRYVTPTSDYLVCVEAPSSMYPWETDEPSIQSQVSFSEEDSLITFKKKFAWTFRNTNKATHSRSASENQ